jgi:hypothetical protein
MNRQITLILALAWAAWAAGCADSVGPVGPAPDVKPEAGETASGDGTFEIAEVGEAAAADAQEADQGGLPCTEDEDCAPLLRGPCSIAICNHEAGRCFSGYRKNGSPCALDDLCVAESYCLEGKCVAGNQSPCNDGDPCTFDDCTADEGCRFLPLDDLACDDGNPCTSGDTCKKGECQGVPEDCPCGADQDCTAFDDDDLCNGVLVCEAGACTPDLAGIVLCPPASGACLESVCIAETGECAETAVESESACNDGDPCTSGDMCDAGSCVPGVVYLCDVCDGDEDCKDLDGADLCKGKHICSQGKCTLDPDSLPSCEAAPCHSSACDPASGECLAIPLPDGTYCDDDDFCTTSDRCLEGECQGQAPDCGDGDPCTQDGCDEAGSCFHTALDSIPCEDNDACSEESWCEMGKCVVKAELDCDDDNECTGDSCDPATGCIHEKLSAAPCDDGVPCTGDDQCLDGICLPGEGICACKAKADCAEFEDANLCNGSLICQDNQCVVDVATIVECDTTGDTSCKYSVCNPFTGACGKITAPYGSPCDDESKCTIGDTCFFADCLGGIDLPCDDANPCTEDSCDPESGCVFENLSDFPCEDGDPCTGGDACLGGQCVSGPSICGCGSDADCAMFEDGNPCNGTLTCKDGGCKIDPASVVVCVAPGSACQVASCDPKTGECKVSNVMDGTPCSDDDACTQKDVCVGGKCAVIPLDCDDGNACTEDGCNPKLGCTHKPLDAVVCEDGSSCTAGDKCIAGSCQPGQNTCDCTADSDCQEMDDGNLCNGLMKCQQGKCLLDLKTIVKCDPSLDTECTKNQCDPVSGKCQYVQLSDGIQCHDGLQCTVNDVCKGGDCSGDLDDCDDGNVCTDETCIEGQGCVHMFNAASCDDGNVCTTSDVCAKGLCSGKPVPCDDGNVCTLDKCEHPGGCVHLPASGACDDGSLCTVSDQCVGGECTGTAANCDDKNICTQDECEPKAGCVHYGNNAPCNDSDLCTVDDFCQGGKCQPGQPANCDDAKPCTSDACVPATGCTHDFAALDGTACDDGKPCTTGEACAGGTCKGGMPVSCDDDNPCTTDYCDQAAGCVHKELSNVACDDKNACTIGDKCAGGKCTGQAQDCSDQDPCTKDLCNPTTGCSHTPVANDPPLPCNDGDLCTLTDLCVNGKCAGSNLKKCDDGLLCTTDECVKATGACKTTNNTLACDDGNVCTILDKCAEGVCKGSGALDCNDNNPCTNDSCDPTKGGCVHASNGLCQCQTNADCADDGDKCNGKPTCVNNVCVTDPATVITCPPSTVKCMKKICDGATGDCVLVPDNKGVACDDGQACTKSDQCDGNGKCAGTAVLCDDGNVCTTDSCDPLTGQCKHDNNALACNDSNPCTTNDVCSKGICAGAPVNCSDGNVCTQDDCTASGSGYTCIYSPVQGPCNDGNECTMGDACAAGSCIGTPLVCNDGNVCTKDTCLKESGCAYPPEADQTPCSDGNSCTTPDQCLAGLCKAGAWTFGCCLGNADCNDSWVCSSDSCEGGACRFLAKKCDDGNGCTADVCTAGSCGYSPLAEDVELYFESFDDAQAQGWQFAINPGGSKDIYWSVDSNRSVSAKHSLYVGNPTDHTYNHGRGWTTAYSPPIFLPSSSDVSLSFWYWAGLHEQGCVYDYLKPEVEDGYGKKTELKPWICDSSNGFVFKVYSLEGYGGQSVRILLTFDTYDAVSNNGEGIYIDDFAIVAEAEEDCCSDYADCEDNDLCTDDVCGKSYSCSFSAVPGTFFQEDFDAGSIPTGSSSQTKYWYLDSNNADVLWQVDTARSFDTPYSLYCGNAKTHTYDFGAASATARTPLLSLPKDSKPILRFRLWTELAQTGCWDSLRVVASPSVYGTKKKIYEKCASGSGFELVTVALDSYAGGDLLLYFEFASDASTNKAEGIYVDEIRVEDAAKTSCCHATVECDDKQICTLDKCEGTAGGGICFNRPLPKFIEYFDDGVANGWSGQTDNSNVAWVVDPYKSYSAPNSFYCGNAKYHRYVVYGAAQVTAATPWILLDKSPDVDPWVSYRRLLSLLFSSKHCLSVSVETSVSPLPVPLETVCGSSLFGDKITWVKQEFSLAAYEGTSVKIYFTLSWPNENLVPPYPDAEGAYLDNFEIVYKGCENAGGSGP